MIKNESSIQDDLSPQNCIKNSEIAFIRGICDPLHKLNDSGKLPQTPLLILIDSLDSAELHRPDHGPTIPIFINKLTHYLPKQFKLLLTVRRQQWDEIRFLAN